MKIKPVISVIICSILAAMVTVTCIGAAEQHVTKPKAKAVIQIWMWGGPSQLDTFDPKPDAGNDYCGSLDKSIQTNVPGIQIGQLLPQHDSWYQWS